MCIPDYPSHLVYPVKISASRAGDLQDKQDGQDVYRSWYDGTMKAVNLHKIHGIIIKTVDYGDYDKILNVFTEHEGVISFIAKGALRPKKRGSLPVSPLLEAEFFYTPKMNSTLLPCQEITPKSHFLHLREDLDKLDAACKMVKAITMTQLPGNPAPPLFLLLRYSLHRMKSCNHPKNLLSSFYLKIMRYEGILTLPARCASCDETVEALSSYRNAFYCSLHSPPGALTFSQNDIAAMTTLAYSRDPSEIDTYNTDELLHSKIESLFSDHTSH